MTTRWRVLVWLFAVAQVARAVQVHEWIWDRDPLGALTLVLGGSLAFRPGSATLFLSAVGARLAYFAARLPDVHNQELIEAQILVGVLVVWLVRRPDNDDERFAAVAPVIRAAVVVVYWAAAFQKLNVDFLDVEVGCSATIWRASVERWGMPAAWASFGYAASLATLAAEAGLPVLLVVRRTRSVGLLLALAFHLWLAVDMGVYAFSAMMFFCLTAFTPSGWVRRWNQIGSPRRLVLSIVVLTGAAAALGVWLTVGARLSILGLVWWCELGVAFLAASLYAARGSLGADEPAFPAGGPRGLYWVSAVLILVNAVSPYVGLKTMTSLSMYSNLRTEGRYWNHLIVPRAVKVFGFQDDLIEITASDDPIFQAIADRGELLPRFELRRRLRRYGATIGALWIEYRDEGGAFRFELAPDTVNDPQGLLELRERAMSVASRVPDTVNDPQGLLEGASPVLEKVLHFNRVDLGPRQGCRSDSPPMRRRPW